MKKIFLLISLLLSIACYAQDEKKLYNPSADAEKDIAAAVKKARDEHKFVLIQAGGNWCKWCIEFERFSHADAQIDSVLQSAFVCYHLNMSKENKNKKLFAKYGFAQRFGFPVFIILNGEGKMIHTQNSAYLEDGKKSYDKEKVKEFLEMWSPLALDPGKYESD